MASTTHFVVTGQETMHCGGCEQRMIRGLSRLPGVEKVEASSKTQEVTVTYDPSKVTVDQLKAQAKQVGYEIGVK